MMIGNWKIKWDSSTRGAMIRALLFHLGVRPRRNGARGRKQELTIKSPRDDWEEKKTTREKKGEERDCSKPLALCSSFFIIELSNQCGA